MERVDDALPSWPGLRPKPGGELVLLLDEDPLADGHALLLHLVARALRQGHRVCCLAAAPTPPSHCAAVLRKLGADRAQVEAAFAHLPLLLPLGEHQHHRGPTGLSAVLQQAAEFLGSGGGGGGVLVLDDASLVGGVLGARAAVELVQACRALLHGPGVMADRPTSLLVRAMDAKGDDAEGAAVAPLLLRHADALVEVRPLASGYSRDVHGLITVRAWPGARPEVANFRLLESGIRCDRITTTTSRGGMTG